MTLIYSFTNKTDLFKWSNPKSYTNKLLYIRAKLCILFNALYNVVLVQIKIYNFRFMHVFEYVITSVSVKIKVVYRSLNCDIHFGNVLNQLIWELVMYIECFVCILNKFN